MNGSIGYHPHPLPHAMCWLWDWPLIILHSLSDLGIAFFYVLIPAIALHIYRSGRLKFLYSAYPKLWRRGTAFVLFCGLSHLGSYLEVWYGGLLYYITGINKAIVVIASAMFAHKFWGLREELISIARVTAELLEVEVEEEEESR